MPTTTGSIFSQSKTVGDTLQPFTTTDVVLYEVNIHVKTHDCDYGNAANQETAKAGSVVTFPKINLRDLYLINTNAGNNSVVGVVGTVPHPKTIHSTRF